MGPLASSNVCEPLSCYLSVSGVLQGKLTWVLKKAVLPSGGPFLEKAFPCLTSGAFGLEAEITKCRLEFRQGGTPPHIPYTLFQ